MAPARMLRKADGGSARVIFTACSDGRLRLGGREVACALGHNDDPPRPGLGSAIFLHVARPDYGPTQGCIALGRADLQGLLAMAGAGDALQVVDAAGPPVADPSVSDRSEAPGSGRPPSRPDP